jgi:hypothetical protein
MITNEPLELVMNYLLGIDLDNELKRIILILKFVKSDHNYFKTSVIAFGFFKFVFSHTGN